MTRTCQWCGEKYDTEKESSLFCEDNPRRESNLKYKKLKPSIVEIGAYVYDRSVNKK